MINQKHLSKTVLAKTFAKINETLGDLKSKLYLEHELAASYPPVPMAFEELFLDGTMCFGKAIIGLIEAKCGDCNTGCSGGMLVITGGQRPSPTAKLYIQRCFIEPKDWDTVAVVVDDTAFFDNGFTAGITPVDDDVMRLDAVRNIVQNWDFISRAEIVYPDAAPENPASEIVFTDLGDECNDIVYNRQTGSFEIPTAPGVFPMDMLIPPEPCCSNPEPAPVPADDNAGEKKVTIELKFDESIARPARSGRLVRKQIMGEAISDREFEEADQAMRRRRASCRRARRLSESKLFADGGKFQDMKKTIWD